MGGRGECMCFELCSHILGWVCGPWQCVCKLCWILWSNKTILNLKLLFYYHHLTWEGHFALWQKWRKPKQDVLTLLWTCQYCFPACLHFGTNAWGYWIFSLHTGPRKWGALTSREVDPCGFCQWAPPGSSWKNERVGSAYLVVISSIVEWVVFGSWTILSSLASCKRLWALFHLRHVTRVPSKWF